MENKYLSENFRMEKYPAGDSQKLLEDFSRERHMQLVLLSELEFEDPYTVSIKTNRRILKKAKVSKTALETIRRVLRIPASYLNIISPELATINLNRRIRESTINTNTHLQVISQKPDFSEIDGFLSPKSNYLPLENVMKLLREILHDKDTIVIREILGQLCLQIFFRSNSFEIQTNDHISRGIQIDLPWIMGKHRINLCYERHSCSNVMVDIEKYPIMAMSVNPEVVISNYNNFLYYEHDFEKIILPLQAMIHYKIDKQLEWPVMRRYYRKYVGEIKEGNINTMFDLYNYLTYEASRTPDWTMHTIAKKAAELLQVMRKYSEAERQRKAVHSYFNITEESHELKLLAS